MTNAELEQTALRDALQENTALLLRIDALEAENAELRGKLANREDQPEAQLREIVLFQCIRDYQEKIAQLTERRARQVNAFFRKEIRL